MTVTEALYQMVDLTKQNLQILQVLNDSFFTKANHLQATINDVTYTVPSYIALENKVNHLQDAFSNLVHMAQSGEAWLHFDGNSKEIRVRGYQTAPNPISIEAPQAFFAEEKPMFKDMLSPQPYLKFDMSGLPDDINKVIVKKIIPYNQELLDDLASLCPNINSTNIDQPTCLLKYSDIVECRKSTTVPMIKGTDYLEYDTIYDLPVRTVSKSGSYIIDEVISDETNSAIQQIITITISEYTDLVCTGLDGTDIYNIEVGDYLITWDGSAKLQVIEKLGRQLKLLVVSSEYLNLVPTNNIELDPSKDLFSQVSDYSKLRYFAYSKDIRELHVPLEEDQYVYIAVAPLDSKINVQSEWGTGVMVNTDALTKDEKGSETSFRSYYDDNVKNIGDILTELSTLSFNPITGFKESDVNILTTSRPELTNETLQVIQINKHLNDTDTVKNIRSLYSQKKQYQIDLKETQAKIQALTDDLSQVSYDDMSGTRAAYQAQISDLKKQSNTITTAISKIVDDIAIQANNSEVPIEEAKYRIRGYLDVNVFLEAIKENLSDEISIEELRNYVIGIQCEYRYKNAEIPSPNISAIGDFLFTEWVQYNPPYRERIMTYKNGSYTTKFTDVANNDFNSSANEVKFNQIEIPITQGEIVEIRTRVIWGFGYPFATTASAWSPEITMEFPKELIQDVQVTTIIEENNSDIETNRFENILQTAGVNEHIDDKVQDQDVTFFHRPEHISSGFYTEERRVIPLKDKLEDMCNTITEMQDLIEGTTSEALKVNVIINGVSNLIYPTENNIIHLPAQSQISAQAGATTGSAYIKSGVVYLAGLINITNVTEHSVYLFSAFPGPRDTFIPVLKNSMFDTELVYFDDGDPSQDILPDNLFGPGIIWPNSTQNITNISFGETRVGPLRNKESVTVKLTGTTTPVTQAPRPFLQRGNQWVTFLAINPYDGEPLVGINKTDASNPWLPWNEYRNSHSTTTTRSDGKEGIWIYPISNDQYSLCLDSDSVNTKKVIAPGESLAIPLQIEYKTTQGQTDTNTKLGFLLRNSLFQDPMYYQIQFVASYESTIQDSLNSAKISVDSLTKYNVTVK